MFRKALFALVAGSLAFAAQADIYTWKDAKGVTQYSDQPPPDVAAKPTRTSGPAKAPVATDASAPQSAPAANPNKNWAEKDLEFRQRKAAEADAAAKKQKEEAQQAQKDAHCKALRDNLAMMERGGRISQPNGKGESELLSDAQIAQQASQLRSQIAADCK